MNTLMETLDMVVNLSKSMIKHTDGGRVADCDVTAHTDTPGTLQVVLKYPGGHIATYHVQDTEDFTRDRRIQLEFMLFGAACASFDAHTNRPQEAA